MISGQVVALLQPKPDKGHEVLGVGKVVTPPSNFIHPLGTVVVYLAYIEPQSPDQTNTHPELHVGECVVWGVHFLAIYGQKTTDPKEKSNSKLRKQQAEPTTKPAATISDSPVQDPETDDKVLNYSLQIIQLGTLLMQLHDTEKVGDGFRSVRNVKLLMLYFRSRPRGMKYAYEMMRFLTMMCKSTLHRESGPQDYTWPVC